MASAPSQRSPLVLIVLVVAAIAVLAVSGWFLLGRGGSSGESEESTTDAGGAADSGGTGGLQSFIIGSWGQDGDCGDRVTFESGGRLTVAREGEGTWSLRREGERDILVAEIGGQRQEAEVERRGEGMEMTQSRGNELAGSYTRCSGSRAEGRTTDSDASDAAAMDSGSASTDTGMTMGSNAPRPIPPDGLWLVGRWGITPDCARILELRADGVMINHRGERASWATGTGPNLTVTLHTPGGSATGRPQRTPEGVVIRPLYGGQEMNLTRC